MDNVINGCYRLSWRERIGFCSGDLAQNLIYQTVSIWLLFYYNNVYGLDSAVVAVMFLVVRIIDVVWDPMVGAMVDKSHPRWGKYRSWLILGALATIENPRMPMIIEHLTTDEEYVASVQYVRDRLSISIS